MRRFVTRVLRGRKVLIGKDFYQARQIKLPVLTLGNPNASWTIFPEKLNQESVVYSFGVGTDISFDLLLMESFGVEVHAFDPSPLSVDWIGKQVIPEGFHFYSYGIADTDGTLTFTEPEAEGHQSLRINTTRSENALGPVIYELPVRRLERIAGDLGHQQIDILKMDIEGAEYSVIDDILASGITVRQLLVEFHHRFENIGVPQTRLSIDKLNKEGYSIFHVSPSGEEISFINTRF